MPKRNYIQFRVTEDEERWINELAEDYGIDRSKLILFALEYVLEQRPAFQIQPKGKALSLAGIAA